MSSFNSKYDKSVTRSMQKRLLGLFMLFILLAVVITGRLVYLQLIIGDDLKAKAREQQTNDVLIPAKRGVIYDREKRSLALSSTVYTLIADPNDIKKYIKEEKYDETIKYMAEKISGDLKIKEKDVYKKLLENVSYEVIARDIDKNKIDKVKKETLPKSKEKLPGLQILEGSKRYYPYNNFLSHVIGFTGSDGNGLQGIEAEYNNYLCGTPGRMILEADTFKNQIPSGEQEYINPKDGNSIILTVDDVIQHYAEDALEQALIETHAKRGTVIAMNPKTGEILALVNKPDFNLNKPSQPIDKEEKKKLEAMNLNQRSAELQSIWRNFAISDSYEPGSTFKIITAATGLEEAVVNEKSQFYCGGSLKVTGTNVKCDIYPQSHGNETFEQGLANSCNVVFMTTGLKIGAVNMNKYAKAFGVGETTGIDIPGEGQGLLHLIKDMKDLEVATMSFGQGITVTPIEMINAVCAVANDGKLMKPHILKQVIDKNGKIIVNKEPSMIRQVVSKKTANKLSNMLEKVVSEGTGTAAQIEGYKISGKTGTAEKLPRGNGKYVTSFVGFAPSDDPQIAIIVVLDEPDAAHHFGGVGAAPVFKKVMEGSLNYLGIKKEGQDSNKITISDYRNMTLSNAVNDLKSKKIPYQVGKGSGNLVVAQSPVPGIEVNDSVTVRLILEKVNPKEEVIVPDLMNKTIEQANEAAAASKLILNIDGNEGKVVSQKPDPGQKVPAGTEVIINLSNLENKQVKINSLGD